MNEDPLRNPLVDGTPPGAPLTPRAEMLKAVAPGAVKKTSYELRAAYHLTVNLPLMKKAPLVASHKADKEG